MSRLGVVIQSEYKRRVRTKTFIFMTLLMPILVIAVILVVGAVVVSSVSSERDVKRLIAVFDPGNQVYERLVESAPESVSLTRVSGSLASLKGRVAGEEFDALLVVPEGLTDLARGKDVYLHTNQVQSMLMREVLRRFVLGVVREQRLEAFDLPRDVYNAISRGVRFNIMQIDEQNLDETGRDTSGDTLGLIGYGIAIGIGIFMLVTIYGGMVMQAVMEEKTSRMAEILVSTLRPFDLLLGKVVALAGLAVTQLLIWLMMMVLIAMAAGILIGFAFTPEDFGELATVARSLQSLGEMDMQGVTLPDIRGDVVLVTILMITIGYLLYASMFGALGAVFESNQDAQMAMMLPMTPLILSMVMVETLALAPNSLFIKIGSLLPFTAPVIMPTRMLLTDVPWFEVVGSVVIALLGALAMAWVAARIFRVGLLLYGKKPNLRDILRMVVSA